MGLTRLYYEAHITVAEEASYGFDRFAFIARPWKASKFDVDEVDHYNGAWFLSNRSRSLEEIKSDTKEMVSLLQNLNYTVIRWKIEETMLDSKHGDIL